MPPLKPGQVTVLNFDTQNGTFNRLINLTMGASSDTARNKWASIAGRYSGGIGSSVDSSSFADVYVYEREPTENEIIYAKIENDDNGSNSQETEEFKNFLENMFVDLYEPIGAEQFYFDELSNNSDTTMGPNTSLIASDPETNAFVQKITDNWSTHLNNIYNANQAGKNYNVVNIFHENYSEDMIGLEFAIYKDGNPDNGLNDQDTFASRILEDAGVLFNPYNPEKPFTPVQDIKYIQAENSIILPVYEINDPTIPSGALETKQGDFIVNQG